MDYFAGLDISMDETHVCVLDREGVVIHESKTASTAEAIAGELGEGCKQQLEDLMTNIEADRRDLILVPMLALAAISLGIGAGRAAGVDPAMTIIKRPDEIPWKPLYSFPPGAAESATMFGAIDAPGQYFVLIRWHPGYMSAPHWYETDRLCVVLSGTWYVASGEDFAPDATVPAPGRLFRAPGRRDAPL